MGCSFWGKPGWGATSGENGVRLQGESVWLCSTCVSRLDGVFEGSRVEPSGEALGGRNSRGDATSVQGGSLARIRPLLPNRRPLVPTLNRPPPISTPLRPTLTPLLLTVKPLVPLSAAAQTARGHWSRCCVALDRWTVVAARRRDSFSRRRDSLRGHARLGEIARPRDSLRRRARHGKIVSGSRLHRNSLQRNSLQRNSLQRSKLRVYTAVDAPSLHVGETPLPFTERELQL